MCVWGGSRVWAGGECRVCAKQVLGSKAATEGKVKVAGGGWCVWGGNVHVHEIVIKNHRRGSKRQAVGTNSRPGVGGG